MGGLKVTGSLVSLGDKQAFGTDIGIKKSSNVKPLTPDKNKNGKSSTEEVLSDLTKDSDNDGVPNSLDDNTNKSHTGMLRIGVRPQAKGKKIGSDNGSIAFGKHRVGNHYEENPRSSITNADQIIADLSSGN